MYTGVNVCLLQDPQSWRKLQSPVLPSTWATCCPFIDRYDTYVVLLAGRTSSFPSHERVEDNEVVTSVRCSVKQQKLPFAGKHRHFESQRLNRKTAVRKRKQYLYSCSQLALNFRDAYKFWLCWSDCGREREYKFMLWASLGGNRLKRVAFSLQEQVWVPCPSLEEHMMDK